MIRKVLEQVRFIQNPCAAASSRPYHQRKLSEKNYNAKEILTKHEKSFHPPTNQLSIIKRIDASALPSNSPMEDSQIHFILNDGSILLGVLDGHWSNDCANLVSKLLPLFIENQLDESMGSRLLNAFHKLDKAILDLPWTLVPELDDAKKINSMNVTRKLEILMQLKSTFSGSCAVVAHINNEQLHIAHAGDCRAVIGKIVNNKLKPITLTSDHQPSSLLELSRLQKEHPGEDDTVAFSSGDGPLRVLGGMMPSRAFGDARYKWSLEQQKTIDTLLTNVPIETNSWVRPPNLKTPPYLTARPEVCKYILDDDVKFLILASDGIFDVFTNADIVREVGSYLNNLEAKDYSNIGTHLIRLAVGGGRGPKHLAQMLSLPPRISRMYRDDMTIQVVFFNNLNHPLPEVESVELEKYKH